MKRHMKKILVVVLAVAFVFSLTACNASGNDSAAGGTTLEGALNQAGGEMDGTTIKVGLLTASSGSTSVLDTYIEHAFIMGIDEINAAGGVNGKQIEIISEDYASDPSMAAEKAEKLIVNDGVCCIFGVVLSSCRQSVLPVVEKYDNLLIYPTDYEGLEQSDNIIYLGCVPNQQVQVIAPWLVDNIGKKVYVIGSDYLYPRSTCAQLISILEENGATIVGEEYVSMDETDYTTSITKIMDAEPDVVFSVLVGDCINAFQKQYAQYGVEDTAMFHMCMDESGAAAIGVDACEGVYSGQTYYCTVESAANNEFTAKYSEAYGTEPTVYASTSYSGAYLLKAALETAGDEFTTADLVEAFHGKSFDGPAGTLTVQDNNHTSLTPRIGQVNSDCLFDVLYEAGSPIAPNPFAGASNE
ncbi:MAG: transporter substrate-binding protein [Bacteroides sp.]|nr:transporter substrate-binding protein [Bacteroides sp.]MCM1549127.1 transporter substrate-binding protein [Clostridium sp.]